MNWERIQKMAHEDNWETIPHVRLGLHNAIASLAYHQPFFWQKANDEIAQLLQEHPGAANILSKHTDEEIAHAIRLHRYAAAAR